MTAAKGRVVLHVASEELTLRSFVFGLEKKMGRLGYTFKYAADEKSIDKQSAKRLIRMRVPRGLLLLTAWFRNQEFREIAHNEGLDIIHIHTPATALALYPHLRALRARPVKLFYTARGGYDEGVGVFRRGLWFLTDPLRWNIWDGVAVINPALERKSLQFHPLRKTFKLSFGGATPNIREDADSIVRTVEQESEKFKLAWVGRFARDKRIEDFYKLVEILNRRSKNRFSGFLIGGATLYDRHRPRKPNAAVIELGWLDTPQVVLGKLDLLVSTSSREGYGLSVVEAALVGTPSFAYRTNGTVESSKITLSRLVESRDISALADAILRWSEFTLKEKAQLREDVARLSKKAYDDDRLATELSEAYTKTCSVLRSG